MTAPVEARAGETARRRQVRAAMFGLFYYETGLARHLIDGLRRLPGVTGQGITDPAAMNRRGPTVSFTHERVRPAELSRALAEDGIFVWDGHNYAVEVVRRLGLLDSGGVLRVGLAHYNTEEEVERLLQVLRRVLQAR